MASLLGSVSTVPRRRKEEGEIVWRGGEGREEKKPDLKAAS